MTFKTAPKNKRSQAGNGKVLVVVVLLVAGGVAAALWLKGDCGWGKGGGGGSGDDTAIQESEKTTTAEEKTEDVAPAAADRQLVIVVDGERYLHNDVEVDIRKVIELAGKVPEGSGPQVRIVLRDSALARAEEALKKELSEAGFDFDTKDAKE